MEAPNLKIHCDPHQRVRRKSDPPKFNRILSFYQGKLLLTGYIFKWKCFSTESLFQSVSFQDMPAFDKYCLWAPHAGRSLQGKLGSVVSHFLLIPPPQFTNCSPCLAESIWGKCKVNRLPCDLAAGVKVGDVYKMVCILPTREIKRLAKSCFRHALPTGGRVALFPVCCTKKRVHKPYTTAASGKQWQQKFASGIHKLCDIWLNPSDYARSLLELPLPRLHSDSIHRDCGWKEAQESVVQQC